MSSTSTHSDDARIAAATQQMSEWRARLDEFATAFDEEVSQILSTLSTLSFEEVPRGAPGNTGCGKTMEFALPSASPPVQPTTTPPPSPASASVMETDRLAALKAKLSQQMASTGQPTTAPARSAEGGRS